MSDGIKEALRMSGKLPPRGFGGKTLDEKRELLRHEVDMSSGLPEWVKDRILPLISLYVPGRTKYD